MYLFYTATSIAVLVLRHRAPAMDRPFRVPGYPWTTIAFCVVCVLLIHGAFAYKPLISTLALAFVLAGVPVYALSRGRDRGA